MDKGLGHAPQKSSAEGRNVAEQVHVDRPDLPAQLAIDGLHPQLLPELAQSTMPTGSRAIYARARKCTLSVYFKRKRSGVEIINRIPPVAFQIRTNIVEQPISIDDLHIGSVPYLPLTLFFATF